MSENDKILTLFTTRMRQMILQYKEKVQETKDLYEMVEELEKKISMLEAQLAQAQRDYESLKMAKMLEITDGDLEAAKARVAKIIRDVNKCITLLKDK